ncbi:MAG: rRNA maturation RNase YbeY [Deltaproteobacteria bacterium]|nr:rRNA maturation RNase YbeY [Deltaproteobacteria bacterium]MBW2123037.1 rRNA maturation RNase YbeY [Deltaproteobacteria bacterium]
MLEILGLEQKDLSILLADDPTIADLNERYLGKARPTNVIAFPMQEGPFSEINPRMLGDVVVSIETARRQAREAGIAVDDVIDRLLAHGILHLAGYDHEGPEDQARRMEEKEEEILRTLEREDGSHMRRRRPKGGEPDS